MNKIKHSFLYSPVYHSAEDLSENNNTEVDTRDLNAHSAEGI
jgi:hypothetical protein